jgi:hypothetical protein
MDSRHRPKVCRLRSAGTLLIPQPRPDPRSTCATAAPGGAPCASQAPPFVGMVPAALDFSGVLRHEVTKGFFVEDELFGVSFHS